MHAAIHPSSQSPSHHPPPRFQTRAAEDRAALERMDAELGSIILENDLTLALSAGRRAEVAELLPRARPLLRGVRPAKLRAAEEPSASGGTPGRQAGWPLDRTGGMSLGAPARSRVAWMHGRRHGGEA